MREMRGMGGKNVSNRGGNAGNLDGNAGNQSGECEEKNCNRNNEMKVYKTQFSFFAEIENNKNNNNKTTKS